MTSRKSRITAALAKRERDRKRYEASVAELQEAIVDGLDDGLTKVEIAGLIGISRERVRLIENEVRQKRAAHDARSDDSPS